MLLSLIIPSFNEEKNIPFIIKKTSELTNHRNDIEVILVNNGSTDNSKLVFENELKYLNKDIFKLCSIEVNQGYGFGIMSGLKIANGDVLAWTHADLQTDPIDVVNAFIEYKKFNNENIIIKGKRKKRPIFDKFFTFAMQIIVFLYLKCYITDINAQPKLFSKSFFDAYIKNNAPNDFSLDLFLLYTAKKNNCIIKTIPVNFSKRIYGEAKGGGSSLKTKIKLTKRTLQYIRELREKILADRSEI